MFKSLKKDFKFNALWLLISFGILLVYLVESLKGRIEEGQIYMLFLFIFSFAISNIIGSLQKEDNDITILFVTNKEKKVAKWIIKESKLTLFLPKVGEELRLSKSQRYLVKNYLHGALPSNEWNKIICEVSLIDDSCEN